MKLFVLVVSVFLFVLFAGTVHAAMVMPMEMFIERYGLEPVFIDEENGKLHFIDGLERTGDYYFVFGDEKITYLDFLYNTNLKDYIENMPCVPEDQQVWRFEYCCEGTEPYIKPNIDGGQQRCKVVSSSQKFQDKIIVLTSDPSLIIAVVILLVIVAAGVFYFARRKRK